MLSASFTQFVCSPSSKTLRLRQSLHGGRRLLFEAIRFEDGRITNATFSDYRVPRFRDLPANTTVLVNRPDLASAGAGETPIACIAPAIGNAIRQTTGERLRSLPMLPKLA